MTYAGYDYTETFDGEEGGGCTPLVLGTAGDESILRGRHVMKNSEFRDISPGAVAEGRYFLRFESYLGACVYHICRVQCNIVVPGSRISRRVKIKSRDHVHFTFTTVLVA